MKKLLSMSLAVFTLLISSFSHAAGNYQSVEEMVRDQKVIRALFDEAPGFGNQAATINVMNRVRQMGFSGTFELIYPDKYQEDIDKVISLFNLPKPLPPVYTQQDSEQRRITFIAESEYIKRRTHNEVDAQTLGITGAHDLGFEEVCSNMSECKPYADNFAIFTNTQVFVAIQPWFSSPGLDAIDIRDGNVHRPVDPYGKFLVYPVFSFDDVKKYTADDPAGQALIRAKPALKALIDGIENKDFNLLPVYGWTFVKLYSDEDEEAVIFPQNIIQVITAGRYAQLNGNAALQKPLIVPVFYNYTEEVNEIASLIQQDSWGEYEKQGGAQMRAAIQALGLKKPNVFLTASLADSDAAKKIQSLQPGQILLLSMGPLPKVVFDGLYSHVGTNMLPPFREGEGSLSMLLLKGQPNFRCANYLGDTGNDAHSKWEPSFDLVSDAALKSRLLAFYGKNSFCSARVWVSHPEIYKIIGEFIIEAKEPGSLFAKYFTDLLHEAHQPENDRIYRGLEEAWKVVNKV